jgi:hypothetical protein
MNAWSEYGRSIRFVPKSERERSRLIREARAIYDSIFRPANAVGEQQNKAPVSHLVSGANARSSDPQLAECMKRHPAERLAAWRCVIGKQYGRGPRMECSKVEGRPPFPSKWITNDQD